MEEAGFDSVREAHSSGEASLIDFVHEKRHMDVGEGGVGACNVPR